jgi:hypothetical protein
MLNSINIPTAAMKRLLIFDYRCSVCWGPLITDGEDGQVVCSRYPEHQGFVSGYYVNRRRSQSEIELMQVRQMIEDTPDLRKMFYQPPDPAMMQRARAAWQALSVSRDAGIT